MAEVSPSGFWNRESCPNNRRGFLKRAKKHSQKENLVIVVSLSCKGHLTRLFLEGCVGKLTSYQIRRGLPTPAALWRQGCSSSVFPGPNNSKAEQVSIPCRHVHGLMYVIHAWYMQGELQRSVQTTQHSSNTDSTSGLIRFPSLADQDECPLLGRVCAITIISKTCLYTHVCMFKIRKKNKQKNTSQIPSGSWLWTQSTWELDLDPRSPQSSLASPALGC